MSKKKVGKESKRGGAREGSGRPKGLTKVKLSVSVDQETFERAMKKFKGKQSALVEKLLIDYVEG